MPCHVSHKALNKFFLPSLHALEDSLLELAVALDLLASIIGAGLAVEGEQVAEVELWCLEELDLADMDLM